MTGALASPDLAQRRARNAQKMRKYRAGGRAQDRAQHRRAEDDIGPAILGGEAITDDLDRCDAKWARLLAGQRYVDAVIRRLTVGVYESVV